MPCARAMYVRPWESWESLGDVLAVRWRVGAPVVLEPWFLVPPQPEPGY